MENLTLKLWEAITFGAMGVVIALGAGFCTAKAIYDDRTTATDAPQSVVAKTKMFDTEWGPLPAGTKIIVDKKNSALKVQDRVVTGESVGGEMRGDQVKGSVALAPISVGDLFSGKAFTKGQAANFNNTVKIVVVCLGALLIIVGIGFAAFGMVYPVGVSGIAAGALLVLLALVAEAISVVLIVGGIIIALVIAYTIYKGWANKQVKNSLTAVVSGVEASKPEAQLDVKANIAKIAENINTNVKKIIGTIKANL